MYTIRFHHTVSCNYQVYSTALHPMLLVVRFNIKIKYNNIKSTKFDRERSKAPSALTGAEHVL